MSWDSCPGLCWAGRAASGSTPRSAGGLLWSAARPTGGPPHPSGHLPCVLLLRAARVWWRPWDSRRPDRGASQVGEVRVG